MNVSVFFRKTLILLAILGQILQKNYESSPKTFANLQKLCYNVVRKIPHKVRQEV